LSVISKYTVSRLHQTVSDEDLLDQFLAGDDDAYVKLFERYDKGLLTYLRTILKDTPEAADDLFQETFVRLFRERDRARERGSEYGSIKNLRGWLFRVAHNLAISHLRSDRPYIPLSEMDSDGGRWDERLMVPIEESFEELYGDTRRWNDAELYERLRACVELLPQSLREVYVLREINGLEYEQVAQVAGCSQEAARMRISRARRALRKSLSKYLDFGVDAEEPEA
jgi:RNA polymerase sigma-70 factor (ECF subfamily)